MPEVTTAPLNPATNPIEWTFSREPRETQSTVLEWIDGIPESKILMCGAPTGTGKSAIAMSLCQSQGGITLVPQKLLAEQYTNDWPDINVVHGMSSYDCHSYQGFSCMLGRVRKCQNARCEYTRAVNRYLNDRASVTNYHFHMAVSKINRSASKHWLVADEAHLMEDILVDSERVIVNEKLLEVLHKCNRNKQSGITLRTDIEKLNLCDDDELYNIIQRLATDCYDIVDGIKDKSITGLDPKTESTALRVCQEFSTNSSLWEQSEIEYVKYYQESEFEFSLRPLYPTAAFERCISKAGRMLMMSATLPPIKKFRKWFGVTGNIERLDLDHTFPVDNRLVRYIPFATLNSKNLRECLPLIAGQCAKIVNTYKGNKGVIHVPSFKLGDDLTRLFPSEVRNRVILHSPKSDREEILSMFLRATEDVVLVSPSFMEGYDFKDDMSRFTIFPKVPWAYFGDPWVQRRATEDREWYTFQAARMICQGAGRSVRHEEDYATTYILDGAFDSILDSGLLPEWFQKSITR